MADEDDGQSAVEGAEVRGTMDSLKQHPATELGSAIAKQLKQLYGRDISEPLPDRFSTLLEKLAKSEGSKSEPHE